MTSPRIPERIDRLQELARNLWWSWHDEPRRLFRALDYPLWRMTCRDPVKQLHQVSSATLQAAASDPAFLDMYDSAMAAFDKAMSARDGWFAAHDSSLLSGPVAYFSMEFAVHHSLPIYAGGLGILAGDICKEASDLGVPMVAVGFMYPQGYFHQHISADGWQQEFYQELNFEEAPIERVLSPAGGRVVATVRLGDIDLAIGVWLVRVGCTMIYLLDTNLEENPDKYQHLSARLYIADREVRMQQEIVLGIGGARVLRALGINPAVWHANEGHSAFMMLERIREEVARGLSFDEALKGIQARTVFTTHTPVPAGHDAFPQEMVDKYFNGYWQSLGISRERFLQLGQDSPGSQLFNMTALAERMSEYRCAVSELHGRVTCRMWHGLWPNLPEDKVPITYVTNGVHIPSWIAPELYYLFEKYLGKDWIEHHDDPKLWDRLLDIPDDELWAVRGRLKRKLVGAVRERMRSRWLEDDVPWGQILAMGALVDPEVLTIGFARRFTEYKRPTLIFRDIERLKRITNSERYPVQIVFAGKSHPADFPSKHLLHQVYTTATGREFQGRIVFVEDYDMYMARYMVGGVDLWLNTPRRLQEASGTSGMKAALNGVLHMSVRDGWWYEGYNGANGWALNPDLSGARAEEEDDLDARAFYRLLEEEVIPLYYARDRNGVPHGWIQMIKESIRSIVPAFCARRMVKEYTERMYKKAVLSSQRA